MPATKLDPLLLTPINGTGGNDALAATAEDQALFGLNGDDTLTSSFNRTHLVGGRNDDEIRHTILDGSFAPLPEDLSLSQSGDRGEDLMETEVVLRRDAPVSFRTDVLGGNDKDEITVTAQLDGELFGGLAVDGIARVDGGRGNDQIMVDLTGAVISDGEVFVNSEILGGKGDDTIDTSVFVTATTLGSFGKNIVDAGSGNDTVRAFASDDQNADNGDVFNEVTGGRGDDDVIAEATATSNSGGMAVNLLSGGRGNDALTGRINLGTNADSPEAFNLLEGGAGSDRLRAETSSFGDGAPVISHLLFGGSGGDILISDINAEFIEEGVTADATLNGGSGNDTLASIVEIEALFGSIPSEVFISAFGERGEDDISLITSFVADPFVVGATEGFARHVAEGGRGDDTIFSELAGINGVDSDGFSNLFGGSGNDRIEVVGGFGNLIEGGRGNDTLIGSNNDDSIFGDGGDDIIASGAGFDFVEGGAGSDSFVFNFGPVPNSGLVDIADFDRSEDALGFAGLLGDFDAALAALEAASTFIDGGVGGDVFIGGPSGVGINLIGAGTGAVSSFADLVDDPTTQLFGADFVFA